MGFVKNQDHGRLRKARAREIFCHSPIGQATEMYLRKAGYVYNLQDCQGRNGKSPSFRVGIKVESFALVSTYH
jgi:hypothetical protein